MMMISLRNHLFKRELFFSLVGFSSEFRRVRVARETPDLIRGVFDQGGPEEVTTLFSVRGKLTKGRKLIRIARDFHFARFPVDERIDFFQPGQPKDEWLGAEVRDEHVDRRGVSTDGDVHADEVSKEAGTVSRAVNVTDAYGVSE